MFERLLLILLGLAVGASSVVPSRQELVEKFEKAQKLFVIEDFRGAIKIYDDILRVDSPFLTEDSVIIQLGEDLRLPVKLAARYQLANAYRRLNNIEEAIRNFRLVEQDRRDTLLAAMAQYQIILCYYDQQQYREVIRECEYLIRTYPTSAYVERAYYNIGWAYYDLKQFEKAAEAFSRQVRAFPEGQYAPRAQYQIGQCYYEARLYRKAIQAFRELIDRYAPKEITEKDWSELQLERLREKSQATVGLGKGREAENVLELSAKAHLLIGDCFVELAELDSAVEAYRRVTLAFSRVPSLVETAFLKWAEVEQKRSGLEGAIRIYRQAIDNSEDPVFRGKMQYQIAKLLQENRRFDEAVREYRIYLEAYGEVAGQVGFTRDAAYYQMALASYDAERYDRALEYYSAVVDSFPNSPLAPSALFGIGLVHQKRGEFDRAIDVFRSVVEKYPEDEQAAQALLQIARTEFDRKRYEEAVRRFEQLLGAYATSGLIDSGTVWFELGRCYRDMGSSEKAFAAFERVPANSDYFAAARSEIAELYVRGGEFAKAERVLLEAIEEVGDAAKQAELTYFLGRLHLASSMPDKAAGDFSSALPGLTRPELRHSALYGLGVAYFQLANYDSAAVYFEALLKEPGVIRELAWKAAQRLANCYFRMGQGEKAIELAERQLAEATEPTERTGALLLLAQVYFDQQQYDRAIAFADSVLRLEPEGDLGLQALFVRGNSYLNSGDLQAAVETYQHALRIGGDSPYAPDFLYQLGVAYYNAEEYEKAAEVFDQLAGKFPAYENRVLALYYGGYALFRLGMWEQSRKSFLELARQYPEHELAAEALYQAAECAFNGRDFERAVLLYREVEARFPRSPFAVQALYNVGWSLVNDGRLEEAMEVFRELIRKYPGTDYAADAQFTIGDYYYNRREYEKAKEAYAKVAEYYPQSPLAAKAREHIHEIDQIQSYLAYQKAIELFDQKKYREAIKAFEEVIRQYPDADVVVGAQCNMAAAYEQLGDYEKALQLFLEIIEKYKDSPEHQDALAFAQEHRDWIMENR